MLDTILLLARVLLRTLCRLSPPIHAGMQANLRGPTPAVDVMPGGGVTTCELPRRRSVALVELQEPTKHLQAARKGSLLRRRS